jgi:hypothetical protein
MRIRKQILAVALSCLSAGIAATRASAVPLSYRPDVAHNSVTLDALIPVKRFMNIALPKGSVEFDMGAMSINLVPNWNFDRIPVLRGPVIRTEVTTNGKEAVIAGVALFTQGWWYNKYWTSGSRETIVTTSGQTIVGRITDFSRTTLTVASDGAAPVTVNLSDIKELHSPRAYAFAMPAVAASDITPDTRWKADVQTVTLSPTVQTDNSLPVASMRRDPLLSTKDEGDWSDKKMVVIGTALSLLEIAQFTPELVLPQFSHQIWQHNNKKSFATLTAPLPANPAPLTPSGNTYSFPGAATH